MPPTETPPLAVRRRVDIAAPAERVWAAWTDPRHLSAWFPDRVEGTFARGERITFAWDHLGLSLPVEVARFEPPRALALRGHPPGRSPQLQEVTVEEDAAVTHVEVVHSGFGSGARAREEAEGTGAGWETMLAVLKLYVERHWGRTRTSFAALGPMQVDFDRLFALFTQAGLLSRWLGAPAAADLAAPGDRFRWQLGGSVALSGEVLCRCPPRQIALRCRELDGVILLRAFSLDGSGGAGAKLVGAQVWSWNDGPAAETATAEIAEAITAAIDRLVALAGAAASA